MQWDPPPNEQGAKTRCSVAWLRNSTAAAMVRAPKQLQHLLVEGETRLGLHVERLFQISR